MTGDSVYNGFRGYGQAEQCVPSDAVPPAIGSRLPLVIKSDAVRTDPPGCTAEHIRLAVEDAAVWDDPAYVVLTYGERKVKIPVQSAGYDGHELHIHAEAGE